jgi:hypothetical protein
MNGVHDRCAVDTFVAEGKSFGVGRDRSTRADLPGNVRQHLDRRVQDQGSETPRLEGERIVPRATGDVEKRSPFRGPKVLRERANDGWAGPPGPVVGPGLGGIVSGPRPNLALNHEGEDAMPACIDKRKCSR